MNVDLELRRGIGHCRECRDRRELSGLKIETGAAVHLPEGKLDQIRREIRRDIAQTCNDAFPVRYSTKSCYGLLMSKYPDVMAALF